MRVLPVRHGETTWNRDGRVQGWAPSKLTDRGHEQAAKLAAAVADRYDVDRLVTSDLERARQTAAAIADETGLDPSLDEGWRERNFGRLQGIRSSALYDEFDEFSIAAGGRDAVEERPMNGESAADMRDRVVAAWERLVDGLGPDETAVVVCHAGPLHVVVSHVRDVDIAPAMGEQDNCALNEIRVEDGDATLVRQNATDFL